jgi:hypothetical protein
MAVHDPFEVQAVVFAEAVDINRQAATRAVIVKMIVRFMDLPLWLSC